MNIFENSKVDKLTFGMYLLDRYPVFKYSDVREALNVALIGESIILLDFFKIVVSACHMTGRKLNVSIISEDANTFMETFLKKNPMAKDTFCIKKIEENGNVTHLSDTEGKYAYAVKNNGPLVDVYVINRTIESMQDIQSIDKMVYSENTDSLFKYSWVIGTDSNENEKIAGLVEGYQEKGIFYENNQCNSFIGELNIARDQLITYNQKKKRIVHVVISLDAAFSEMKSFQQQLKEMAFNIHRFYAKEYNSRQSIKEMKNEFKKAYQMTSSMRSAITIPYKLASVMKDIPEDINENIIDEFCKIVFEENKESYQEKLVYLEHKSWMLWLICDGWKLPVMDEIRKYAFVNGNDFKDKKNKLHPCLIESYENGPMELEALTEQEWDDKKRLNMTKDPLDKVSVKLYLYAKKRAKEICQNGELAEIIAKIAKYLVGNNVDDQNQSEKMEYIHNLETAFEKMAECEKNAVNHFDNCISDFREKYRQELDVDQRLDAELRELMELARVAKEASYHRSYKKSDFTIIKAIPYLLKADKVNCIYKLASDEKSWENLLSTMLIEPKRVVIIYDDWSFEKVIGERKKYDNILEKLGLGHISISSVGIHSAIKTGLLKKVTVNDVVDVTGANASMAIIIAGIGDFKKCPFITVNGMEIRNLTTGKSQKYIYPVQKSLSVAETLELSDAYYYSESDVNDMASFSLTYKNVWSIYYNPIVAGVDLKRVRGFMEQVNRASRKEIKSRTSVKTYKDTIGNPVNGGVLKAYHVDEVLEALKADGIIKKFVIPDNANGFVEITSECMEAKQYIGWMLERCQRGMDHYF